MPYIVRNVTGRTVILSDLRVELGPYKTLDLERVVSVERVEQSRNLRHALDIKALCLVKYSVVHGPRRFIEAPDVKPTKASLSKDEMESLIRKVMSEYQTKPDPVPDPVPVSQPVEAKDNTEAVGKIVESSMNKLMNSIRDEINSIQINNPDGSTSQNELDIPSIDQSKLAEMHQKAVEKIQVSGSVKQGRKIKIKNKNLSSLADELGDI